MAAKGETPSDSRRGRKLFVGNISYRITRRELKSFFLKFGDVEKCRIVKDHRKGWSRGIGFVTFKEKKTADLLLADPPSDQLVLDGRQLRIALPKTPKRVELQNSKVQSGESDGASCSEDETQLHSQKLSGSQTTPTFNNRVPPFHAKVVDLTDDLWLTVFGYLNITDRITTERVCRRWHRLAQRSWLTVKQLSFENIFKSIFRGGNGGLTDGQLRMMLQRCGKSLVSLDLSSSPYRLSHFALDLIGTFCPNVLNLNLTNMGTTKVSLKNMVQRLPHLKYLNVCHCQDIGEKAVWWVLNSLKSLEYLNLTDNRRLTGQCFFQAGMSIKEIVLADCTNLTDAGVDMLAQRSSHLVHVDISRCSKLSGSAIVALAKNCLLLKNLYFASDGNKDVSTEHFLSLGQLHDLQELVLDKHMSVTDDVLCVLGANCQELRYLSVELCQAITDVGIQYLSECTRLSHIVLNYCHKVTDDGLVSLSVGHEMLQKVSLRACLHISDRGIGQLCSSCPELQEVDISGCLSVTNRVLPILQETLQFVHKKEGSDFTIVFGGTSVDPVEALEFARNVGVTVSLYDLSIAKLAQACDPYMNFDENWEEELHQPFDMRHVNEIDDDWPGLESDEEALEYDFLQVDDPAMYSDEFSNPEDFDFD